MIKKRTFTAKFMSGVLSASTDGVTVLRNDGLRSGKNELVFRYEDELYQVTFDPEKTFTKKTECIVVIPQEYTAIRYVGINN